MYIANRKNENLNLSNKHFSVRTNSLVPNRNYEFRIFANYILRSERIENTNDALFRMRIPIKRAFQHCWGPTHYYSRILEYIGNEIFRERSGNNVSNYQITSCHFAIMLAQV